MKKRVVITGMGVVSPNGIGTEEFCRAALDWRQRGSAHYAFRSERLASADRRRSPGVRRIGLG